MSSTNWQADWEDDAPDPEAVIVRVTSLVARRMKLLSERRLRSIDHTDLVRLLVAADTYYDLFSYLVLYSTPDAAEECYRVHKEFAERAVSVRVGNSHGEWPCCTISDTGDEAFETLSALAAQCHLSRGRMCPGCRLPLILHATDAAEGPPNGNH